MGATLNGSELVLSGTVGAGTDDFIYSEDGFNYNDVIFALARVGRDKPITVRINSGGGLSTEGSAIYAALASHGEHVTTVVEGVAASAASLIAMAGDRREMAPGAVMMIHDVSGMTFGTADDHEDTIRALEALSASYASIYAETTGVPVVKVRKLMRDETWFTAEQAVEEGFADAVRSTGRAEPVEPTPFGYGVYAHAPAAFVALANARGWKAPRGRAAPAAQGEQPMKTRDTRAGARRTLRAQEGDAPPPVQEPNAPPPGSDDKAPVPGSDPRHEEMGDDPRDQPGRPSGAPPIDAPSYNPANDPGADPGQTEPGTVPDPKPKPPTEADTTLDPKGGAPGNPEDKPQVDAEAAASIAELCAAAGAPMLAAGFIRSRTSVADVRKRLDAAGAVRNLVAVARKASSAIGASVADEMIARGLTVDQAKAELFDKLHASVADISPIAPAPKEPGSDLLSKAAARINAQRTRTRLRQEVRH